jgi:hypothetical protein
VPWLHEGCGERDAARSCALIFFFYARKARAQPSQPPPGTAWDQYAREISLTADQTLVSVKDAQNLDRHVDCQADGVLILGPVAQ